MNNFSSNRVQPYEYLLYYFSVGNRSFIGYPHLLLIHRHIYLVLTGPPLKSTDKFYSLLMDPRVR